MDIKKLTGWKLFLLKTTRFIFQHASIAAASIYAGFWQHSSMAGWTVWFCLLAVRQIVERALIATSAASVACLIETFRKSGSINVNHTVRHVDDTGKEEWEK